MLQLLQFDVAIRTWVVLHRAPALDGVMWGLSEAGRAGIIWLSIGAVLVALKRLRPEGWVLLALALVVTALMTDKVLQPAIGRDRPFVHASDIAVIGNRPASGSFPSGHAANAFAGATVLASLATAPAAPWWMLAVATAYSRLYLGVHYPADVVAGALLGFACARLTLVLVRRALAYRPSGKNGARSNSK